jgi:hypothetical protein
MKAMRGHAWIRHGGRLPRRMRGHGRVSPCGRRKASFVFILIFFIAIIIFFAS